MENIGEFYSNNMLLIIMWTILFYMIINSFIKGQWDKSPQEVVQLMNHDSSIMLDVREIKEYDDVHIADSIHIPLGEVKTRLSELDSHKQKTIVVNCRSGQRSARAVSVLRRAGFETVYNLRGGILAWENDKLPVKR